MLQTSFVFVCLCIFAALTKEKCLIISNNREKLLPTLLRIEQRVDEYDATMREVKLAYEKNVKARSALLEQYLHEKLQTLDILTSNVAALGRDVIQVIAKQKEQTPSKYYSSSFFSKQRHGEMRIRL